MADEEYKMKDEGFSVEDAASDLFGEGESSGTPPAAEVLKRGLLAVIGLLLIVFAVYKFSGFFFGKVVKEEAAKEAVPKEAALPVLPAAPSAAEVQAQQLEAQLDAARASQGKQVSEVMDRLNAHQTSLDNLTESVNQVSNNVNAINLRLTSVSDDLEKVTKELAALKTAAVKPKIKSMAHRRMKEAPTRVMYVIQTMYPGGVSPRAWLLGNDESTVTVTKGDYLPGYGRILEILPQKGRIMTSSGAIIRYSPAER